MLFRSSTLADESTLSQTSIHRSILVPALLVLSQAWIFFALLETGLILCFPSTSVHDHAFKPIERLSLWAGELAAITLFLPLLAAPLGLLLLCRRAPWWRNVAFRTMTFLGCAAFFWGLLLLLGASWGGFVSAGSFLDRMAVQFWAPQPLQVFHFVHPLLLYGVPAITLLAAVGLLRLMLWRFDRQLASRRDGAIRLFVYSCALLTLFFFFGKPQPPRSRLQINDYFVGVSYTLDEWYHRSLRTSTGAFIHGLLDIQSSLFPDEEHPTPSARIAVSYPPILPMNQYLASADSARIQHMNVVYVMCESMRADVLRAYGSPREVMPNVERMAAEAQIFLNAYTTSSHTNYAALTPFSSQYPLRSNTTYPYPKQIPFPRVMIYDILKAMGYRTAFFSSENLDWGHMVNYLDTGSVDHLMHAANWGGPTYVNPTDTGFSSWVSQTKAAGSIDDRHTIDEAIKWVDQGEKSAPFFIYFNLQSTHFPYRVPGNAPRKFSKHKPDFLMTYGYFQRDKLQEIRDLYDDSAYYIDLQLGRFFDHLRQRGLWDNTIIVFSGDHGEAFLEHNFATHAGPLYNEVMKVPLVIRIPSLEPARHDRLAQHIDATPTVLHALGLPPHPAHQGIDLLAPESPASRTIYMVAQSPLAHQYALVRDHFKLIYDHLVHKRILYDLRSDPGEKQDVASQYPDLLKSLSERLDTWRAVQIGYYQNAVQQKMSYAPIVSDQ